MNDEDQMDIYIGRCLKNWAARPPSDGKIGLLHRAIYPPVEYVSPITRFLDTFSNRWSSPSEQFYVQRRWQINGPFTQSLNWSFHLATQQRFAH